MGNDIINWRFGCYHLRVTKYQPFVSFGYSPFFTKEQYAITFKKPYKWFERY